VLFIVLGSVVAPIIGWLVGVVLLWTSDRWTKSDKIIGTLVWPGGLGAVGVLGLALPQSNEICGGPAGSPPRCEQYGGLGLPDGLTIFIAVLLVLLPLLVAGVLLRRALRNGRAHPVAQS
jgi:hypothetical protein